MMSRLSLSFLGSFAVTLNGSPVTGFESNKVRALLAYLAVESDQPQRREALSGLLWPEQTEQSARHNLRQSLARLRRAVADGAASPPHLLMTRETIQFNPASDHRLDVAEFTALITACRQHSHRRLEACSLCLQRLAQAVELYAGDFLHQFFLSDSTPFEEWALVKREWLRREALRALHALAEFYERRENYDLALRYALRQMEIDPLREEAHRQVMRALALDGKTRAALAQYETLRRRLSEEIGGQPAQETADLFQHILSGQALKAARGLPGSAWPHNLPAPLTPFIGRETELAQIVERLESPHYRLLTLAGPGGMGKTRLAVEAASRAIEAFRHGIYFVPLASVSAADFLAPAIADALELPLDGRQDPRLTLAAYLRDKDLLLVLDNFEHLTDGVDLLLDLLRGAPAVKLLVTSQARLNLQAEDLFQIDGLKFPASASAAGFAACDAVQLFVERARRVRKDFALAPESAAAVARICRLLEGAPLGIELAAARVEEHSLDEIASEIERSLDFLTTTMRDLPPRQRSLRAAFEYSWGLLSAREQEMCRRLSVFHEGFRPEAASAVAGATAAGLAALAGKSMLRETPAGRYRMHEVVRQYAEEKLAQADEEHERTRELHCRFYADLLSQKREAARRPAHAEAADEMDEELDNVRAAWRWAVRNNREDQINQLLDSLFKFYDPRGWLLQSELPSRMAPEQPSRH